MADKIDLEMAASALKFSVVNRGDLSLQSLIMLNPNEWFPDLFRNSFADKTGFQTMTDMKIF